MGQRGGKEQHGTGHRVTDQRCQGENPVYHTGRFGGGLGGKAHGVMVKNGVAMSPEGRRILPHLTVEENLWLGAYILSDPGGDRTGQGQNL